MNRIPRTATLQERRRNALLVKLACLGLAGCSLAGASPPVPLHRTSAVITEILALGPHAGDCAACHTMHADGQAVAYPKALIGPDDNALCDQCHTTPWTGGSYPGTIVYSGSAHGQSPATIWPGPNPPARMEAGAQSKCVNCHDPHGWPDGLGLIPYLEVAREELLCNACHDGNPATTNVQWDMQKPFRHPVQDKTNVHTGPEESVPAEFGVSPLNRRHSECQDCHNPHVAYRDPFGALPAPALSKTNLGVSRVRVSNGGPGSLPAYSFSAGVDTLSAPLAEYQLCFKCHSSWTTQPVGQTDFALVLNPANPSYHPVEAPGKNPNIAPGAFVPGWSASSWTRCGDCHGSDNGLAAGPHGSIYPAILRASNTASPAQRAMDSSEICFICHAFDVYANNQAPSATLAASRWNPAASDKGHTFHVDLHRRPCYACHVTHGSTTQPHLIATGRVPGLIAYTETPTGGSCTPTCHSAETYAINYAR
jgi:predicted CXXCH cytochrome family protein